MWFERGPSPAKPSIVSAAPRPLPILALVSGACARGQASSRGRARAERVASRSTSTSFCRPTGAASAAARRGGAFSRRPVATRGVPAVALWWRRARPRVARLRKFGKTEIYSSARLRTALVDLLSTRGVCDVVEDCASTQAAKLGRRVAAKTPEAVNG